MQSPQNALEVLLDRESDRQAALSILRRAAKVGSSEMDLYEAQFKEADANATKALVELLSAYATVKAVAK